MPTSPRIARGASCSTSTRSPAAMTRWPSSSASTARCPTRRASSLAAVVCIHRHGSPTSSTRKIGAGLDIRGPDGYVLLPPSRHVSGGQYLDDLMYPLFETPLTPMPAWLLSLATGPQRNGHESVGAETDWAALLAGAQKGERHAVALRIAGHLLGKKLPPREVETILLGYAEKCIPPFDRSDVRRIVRDLAAKDAGRAPSTAPAVESGLGLVSVGELLGEPDVGPTWVVEGRLPSGGLGMVAGKPKAGKSTAARAGSRGSAF